MRSRLIKKKYQLNAYHYIIRTRSTKSLVQLSYLRIHQESTELPRVNMGHHEQCVFFFYCLRLSFAYANPRQSLCQHNHSLRGHSCIVYAYSKPAQLLPATKTYLKLTAQNTYAELQEVGSKPTSNPYWWYIKIPCLDTSMEGSQAQLLQKGLIHGGLELTPTGRLVPSP